MTKSHADDESPGRNTPHADPPTYPENALLGVLDTPEQVSCALDALSGPFLETEIEVLCGEGQADRLRATTGRTGLLDKALRVVQGFGLWNDELEVKAQYEQALRDGHIVVMVEAQSDDRKQLAVEALKGCGGHFINYFGKFTRERIAPWTTARPAPGSTTPLK
jgi:hypothetical protein